MQAYIFSVQAYISFAQRCVNTFFCAGIHFLCIHVSIYTFLFRHVRKHFFVQAYMAERSPFQLRGLLTAWNIFLAVFSIMGAARWQQSSLDFIALFSPFSLSLSSLCFLNNGRSEVTIDIISYHFVFTIGKSSLFVIAIINMLIPIFNIMIFRTLPEFIYTISTQVTSPSVFIVEEIIFKSIFAFMKIERSYLEWDYFLLWQLVCAFFSFLKLSLCKTSWPNETLIKKDPWRGP